MPQLPTDIPRPEGIAAADVRDVLDESALAALVAAFYRRAGADALLGPVFRAALGEGEGSDAAWAAHIVRVTDFWSSVLLGGGRYQGRPMVAHARLPGLDAAHFARWLALFEATARERFGERAAARLVDAARRIGHSLQAGLALAREK